MTVPARHDRLLQYGTGLLIGLLCALYLLPWATIAGTGGLFAYPRGDLPTNLAGHLAYQAPGWHLPLLRAPALAWPHGVSVAMTDSNPALSLLAKLLAGVVGHPVNLFGAWLAACFVLQPLAAIYVLRGFLIAAAPVGRVNAWMAALTAAILVLLLPEYLFRVFHINLMGQFLLLAALGVAVRHCLARTHPGFLVLVGLLLLAVLVHPYLFIFCVVTLAAPLATMLIRRAPETRANARLFGIAFLLPVGIFMLLSGELGAGGPGFGLYSTNLLSPFWPQYSGIFGPTLPWLDATGYQHEGFNYLGAGILLVIAASAVCLLTIDRPARQDIVRRWAGLLCVLLAMFCLAITPHVTFGHVVLLPLQSRLLEQVFGVVRASGRAIWVVDYAILLGALGLLAARLRPVLFLPLMVAAIVVQWIDATPLRDAAQHYLTGADQVRPALVIPPGTTLFRAVPLCGPEEVEATEYRLMALRAGARLTDERLVHPQTDAVCARALAAGLTTPLAPGETRLFMPSVRAVVHPASFGAGIVCNDVPRGHLLLCHAP